MAVSIDKKNLAAGVKEMRSVAKKLLAWADDLEKAGKGEVQEDVGCPAAPDVAAPADSGADHGEPSKAVKEEPAPVVPSKVVKEEPAPAAPPTLSEVKAFLTKKCAAGYSAQVQALIASFGVSSLSKVPAESLGALLDAALLLGQEESEGEAHAG